MDKNPTLPLILLVRNYGCFNLKFKPFFFILVGSENYINALWKTINLIFLYNGVLTHTLIIDMTRTMSKLARMQKG